jgi:hypothetical protein
VITKEKSKKKIRPQIANVLPEGTKKFDSLAEIPPVVFPFKGNELAK